MYLVVITVHTIELESLGLEKAWMIEEVDFSTKQNVAVKIFISIWYSAENEP